MTHHRALQLMGLINNRKMCAELMEEVLEHDKYNDSGNTNDENFHIYSCMESLLEYIREESK